MLGRGRGTRQHRMGIEPRLGRRQQRLKHVDELRLEDVERRLLMRQHDEPKARDWKVAVKPELRVQGGIRRCIIPAVVHALEARDRRVA